MTHGLSRGAFLRLAGAGLGAAVAPSLLAPARALAAGGTESTVFSFVSEPTLKPPTIEVLTRTNPTPGYLFVTSLTGPGQRGPIIFDDHGRLVWFRRTKEVAIDFRVQTYRGKPVLTWWEGTISKIGVGQGVGMIVDESYRTVATVQAGNGLQADVHELLLTPQGTALITAYRQVQADLSSVGGPPAANTLDSVVQEVDVATGKVLLEWHSLDHVPFTDSYAPILDPYDYFHVNSIDVTTDGQLLVSARNTSAVYKVDRQSGQVLWRLGGRSSDFELGPAAFFMYQHDARAHPDGTLTIFDDGPSPSSKQSRGIRVGLDLGAMRADLLQQYLHPTPLAAAAMGNVQVLGGDSVFLGWGTEPYLTEFGPLGDVRFDARFAGGAWNYRAFRNAWTGTPTERPAVAGVAGSSATTVYASWNGSTETAFWLISAGASERALQPAKTVPVSDFETPVVLPGRHAWVHATALDATRRPLADSGVRAVRAHP